MTQTDLKEREQRDTPGTAKYDSYQDMKEARERQPSRGPGMDFMVGVTVVGVIVGIIALTILAAPILVMTSHGYIEAVMMVAIGVPGTLFLVKWWGDIQ